MRILLRPAKAADAVPLSRLAAETFPDACPPGTDPADIERHVAEHLSPQQTRSWIADPDSAVVVAADDSELVGYALVLRGPAADPHIREVVGPEIDLELSKIYVRKHLRGTSVAHAIMAAAIEQAAHLSASPALWLGTNGQNERAQAFYRRAGFTQSGTRRFRVGGHVHDDVVMVRPLDRR